MKKYQLKSLSFFISLITYNFFFWNEAFGLNLMIFAFLLIILLYTNYRESFAGKNVIITLTGTVITAIMVVLFNSLTSKIAHIVSFLLMVTFIHERQMRSVAYAILHMLSGLLRVPLQVLRARKEKLKKFPRVYRLFRIIRQSLIPLLIAIVFYMLYYFANPIFGTYANDFWKRFGNLWDQFCSAISFGRIIYLIAGAVILSSIYFRNEVRIFLERDVSFSEKLLRIKRTSRSRPVAYSSITRGPVYPISKPKFKAIALKNQNRRGVILLFMVNALLLIENFIDIKWLWLGFEIPEGFSLKHYVREGTGFLIASILLSIIVLLYYFRRNQNFYSRNKMLKLLAYVWIAQNAILCFSIFLRNYHYIDFHGLAYKRIGVYVFIAMTIIGLVTLYNKIRNIKSTYYLLHVNTWAAYFILVTLSFFNWDVSIAKYNLNHWNKGEIDVDFYLQLSGKALPVIYADLNMVKEQIEAHNHNKVKWIRYLNYNSFKQDLDIKNERYLEKLNSHSWLSFNAADNSAKKLLEGERYQAFK